MGWFGVVELSGLLRHGRKIGGVHGSSLGECLQGVCQLLNTSKTFGFTTLMGVPAP